MTRAARALFSGFRLARVAAVREDRSMRTLFAVAIALSPLLPGTVHADKAPPPEPPAPASRRLDDARPKRLPDGVFLGKLSGGGDASLGDGADLRVTIVGGQVIEAVVRRGGGLPIFDLEPVESVRSIALRLRGSVGDEFIDVTGAFFDLERGAGRFEGVLSRKKVAGTWTLARR